MGEAAPTSAASRTGQPLGVADSFGAISVNSLNLGLLTGLLAVRVPVRELRFGSELKSRGLLPDGPGDLLPDVLIAPSARWRLDPPDATLCNPARILAKFRHDSCLVLVQLGRFSVPVAVDH